MFKFTKAQWVVLSLVVITLLLRSFITIPNFSPMLGASVVAGMFLPATWAFAVPVISMFASDIVLYFKQLDGKNAMDFISWMSYQPVIYVLMGVSVLVGVYGKKGLNGKYMRHMAVGTGAGIASSGLFFVLSNLIVWLDPWGWKMYTMDWSGFVQCYVMAIPFAVPTFVSTLLFVPIFMVLYRFGYNKLKKENITTQRV
jgi:hypothetical protein